MNPPLRLEFRAPHLSFPPPGPFCLVCGDRPTYPRLVRADGVEFFAPLCGRHFRRAQALRGGAALLAFLAVVGACLTVLIPFNSLAFVPAAAAWACWAAGRKGGLSCHIERPQSNELVFHYRRPITSRPAEDPLQHQSYRPPPPPVPFGYVTAKSYSREEIVGTGKLIAGDRFALLPDRLLAFLESSELTIDQRESILWKPRPGVAVLVPPELHDGSERARRGLGLFIRNTEGPFVYAGRAEVTNWPISGNDCWVRLSLDEPLRCPIPRMASDIEKALRELGPDADREADLRWVAIGDDRAWAELADELQHQGEVSAELVPLAPFLFTLLREQTFAHTENLLWTFALAAQAPPSIRRAAAQGTRIFLSFLDDPKPEIRMPAALALQSCDGIGEEIRQRTARESDRRVRAALLTVLGASEDPSNLPFLLQEIQSGSDPFLRAVAAIAAIELAPDPKSEAAVRYLKDNMESWSRIETEWEAMDLAGAALLDPHATFERLN